MGQLLLGLLWVQLDLKIRWSIICFQIVVKKFNSFFFKNIATMDSMKINEGRVFGANKMR